MQGCKGFTLIELSIVLVIIGLIVGGVLAGRDLIKAAELRYIVSQKEKYSVAANTFRNKYNCVPGDCASAINYFGFPGGNAGDNYTDSCVAFVGLDNTHTCNGSGNGLVGFGGPTDLDVLDEEGLLFWHHLSLAGLIDSGNLTPRPAVLNGGSSAWELPGINIPASRLSASVGFSLFNLCITSGAAYYHNGNCAHTFFYGAQDPSPDSNYLGLAMYPALTALDGKNIDNKIDNGLPATGSVTTVPPGGNYLDSCASSTNMATATYTVTTGGITCALMFNAGF